MTLPNIKDLRPLPSHVPAFCVGKACKDKPSLSRNDAYRIVAPDGTVTGIVCLSCGYPILKEIDEKMGEHWQLIDLYEKEV